MTNKWEPQLIHELQIRNYLEYATATPLHTGATLDTAAQSVCSAPRTASRSAGQNHLQGLGAEPRSREHHLTPQGMQPELWALWFPPLGTPFAGGGHRA